MRIQVRYFAVLRERLRSEGEELALPEGADVRAALDALSERHEPVRRLRGRFQTAVNQSMVPPETALADGDELALIPPVAGGAGEESGRHARMVDEPPSLDRVVRAVSGAERGGVVTFTGMVRRQSQGREVVRLEYEAYVEMAEKVLVELCEEIEAEIPGSRLAVEHRQGILEVGDVAVALAAAAPHRAEAFQACRALIDRLKERAPIWKKEVGPDGEAWVGLGP